MGIMQGAAGFARAFAVGLGNQTPVGIASNAGAAWLADYTFAFHDGEEIGPKMMARIAKKTGLTPRDL